MSVQCGGWVECGGVEVGGGWGASAGWVEVWWRWVEAASDTPTWHGAGGGWWLGGGAGHGPRPSPRVAHLHTSPPLVAAGHCSLSRHLVTSVLTAPLRPRSHQALLRLRLAEVCCWWPRGRGSSRWMAGCGTSSQPPSRGHCTLYTVLYTVQLARPLYTRGRVSDSSWWLVVAGGGWSAQTMSLLHSASSLLTSSPHFCHEPPGTGHNLIRVPCRFLHKLSFYMFK